MLRYYEFGSFQFIRQYRFRVHVNGIEKTETFFINPRVCIGTAEEINRDKAVNFNYRSLHFTLVYRKLLRAAVYYNLKS